MMNVHELVSKTKENPDQLTIEATVATGFEFLALDECRDKCKPLLLTKSKGRIFFNILSSDFEKIFTLKSVDNIQLVTETFKHLPFKLDKNQDLEVVKSIVEKVHWDTALKKWANIVGFKGDIYPRSDKSTGHPVQTSAEDLGTASKPEIPPTNVLNPSNGDLSGPVSGGDTPVDTINDIQDAKIVCGSEVIDSEPSRLANEYGVEEKHLLGSKGDAVSAEPEEEILIGKSVNIEDSLVPATCGLERSELSQIVSTPSGANNIIESSEASTSLTINTTCPVCEDELQITVDIKAKSDLVDETSSEVPTETVLDNKTSIEGSSISNLEPETNDEIVTVSNVDVKRVAEICTESKADAKTASEDCEKERLLNDNKILQRADLFLNKTDSLSDKCEIDGETISTCAADSLLTGVATSLHERSDENYIEVKSDGEVKQELPMPKSFKNDGKTSNRGRNRFQNRKKPVVQEAYLSQDNLTCDQLMTEVVTSLNGEDQVAKSSDQDGMKKNNEVELKNDLQNKSAESDTNVRKKSNRGRNRFQDRKKPFVQDNRVVKEEVLDDRAESLLPDAAVTPCDDDPVSEVKKDLAKSDKNDGKRSNRGRNRFYDRKRQTGQMEPRESAEKKSPPDANDNTLKFRATCYRVGDRHSFSSMEAACEFGGKLQDKFGWTVNLTNFDLNVILNIEKWHGYVCIALTKESLHRRNITHFNRTTLRATLCYNLIRLAEPMTGEIVIDPLCGGGSIPIEGALSFPNTYHICGDYNEKAMDRTKANINHINRTKNEMKIGPVMWNVKHLPLRTQSVDVLVTDLPFGKRSGLKQDNQRLYCQVLYELARVVKQGNGRAVLLTYDKTSLIRALRTQLEYWKEIRQFGVNQGGLFSCVFLLIRKGTVHPCIPFMQCTLPINTKTTDYPGQDGVGTVNNANNTDPTLNSTELLVETSVQKQENIGVVGENDIAEVANITPLEMIVQEDKPPPPNSC